MSKKTQIKNPPKPAAIWPIFVALAIIGAAVALLIGHLHSSSVLPQPQPSPSVLASTHYPSQGHQGHMQGDVKKYAFFNYSSDPPTSGFHREIFSPAFVNSAPLPKYVQVHLLEHGNVLLQYNCICPDVAQALAAIADEYNSRLLPSGTLVPTFDQIRDSEEGGLSVIVAPYPTMNARIALTAWTRLATMQEVNKADIVSFINHWLHNLDNLNQ